MRRLDDYDPFLDDLPLTLSSLSRAFGSILDNVDPHATALFFEGDPVWHRRSLPSARWRDEDLGPGVRDWRDA
jgi:hypothetical protein